MNMPLILMLGLLIGCGMVQAADDGAKAPKRMIYVAPGGDDQWAGDRDHPLASLGAARDRARRDAGAGPCIVELQPGTYYLAHPLSLGVPDNGTTFRAARTGTVTLSGGRWLQLAWTKSEKGIYTAQVPGDFTFDQLFIDGQRQILARYPNYDPNILPLNGHAADACAPARARTWANPVGGFVHALHEGRWGGLDYQITGVDAGGKVQLTGGFQNNRPSRPHKEYRYVENIAEELDAPGEWFFDLPSRQLRFIPPAGMDLAKAKVEVSGLKSLIEITGDAQKPAANITFDGIVFTGTARTFMEKYEPLLRSDWCVYRGGAVKLEGTENCTIRNCDFPGVGGNAIMVSKYNRGATISGCSFVDIGASAVLFVGDPASVRSATFQYDKFIPADQMDITPGPKSPDYPADCVVEDCLMHHLGVVEKQSAGVTIDIAQNITIRHNTIFDVPRSGINIGNGCFGGHVLEFNDVFDAVKETGDHGAFNSWGRDRFWHPNRKTMDQLAVDHPDWPMLDVVKPITMRNNRFQCSHGWAIDLDDGSSNYHIYNNLCLSGGLKLREGFNRVVENNIILNNSFHPHVWFDKSGDVFRHNIVMGPYQPIGMPGTWGKEVDSNVFPTQDALQAARQGGTDANSVIEAIAFDPQRMSPHFVHPLGQAAKAAGFEPFDLSSFGSRKPEFRAAVEAGWRALTGEPAQTASHANTLAVAPGMWAGATVRKLQGQGDQSATGMSKDAGVIVTTLPADAQAKSLGLQLNDVILSIHQTPMNSPAELARTWDLLPAGDVKIEIFRNQSAQTLTVQKP